MPVSAETAGTLCSATGARSWHAIEMSRNFLKGSWKSQGRRNAGLPLMKSGLILIWMNFLHHQSPAFYAGYTMGLFFSCQYRVERIEKVVIQKPQRRIIRRYLVTKRPQAREKKPEDVRTQFISTRTHDVFTNSAAIEHFDRVLLSSCNESDDSHAQ